MRIIVNSSLYMLNNYAEYGAFYGQKLTYRNKTSRLKESIEFFHRSNISIDFFHRSTISIEFFHRSKFSIDRNFQSIRFNARLIYPIAKSRDMGVIAALTTAQEVSVG